MRSLAILGSTGSIGTQTLEVAASCGHRVLALTAHHNIDLLERQARTFHPILAAAADPTAAAALASRLADTDIQVLAGEEGVLAAAQLPQADTAVTALVGIAGLAPTLAAIDTGKRIALANKETLVCAGPLVMARAREKGAEIVPVDSEHSAIFQSLQGSHGRELKRILLTASGGPFFGWTREALEKVTPDRGSPTSQLVHGSESDHRLGHLDEQGAGTAGGHVPLCRSPGEDSNFDPPGEHTPLSGGIL